MIPILTFKPVLIGCQFGLFVVHFLLNLLFDASASISLSVWGRNFRPNLDSVLCWECITPTVILIFADISRMLWKPAARQQANWQRKTPKD